jgi:uncharacterized membrane protein YfcA
MLSDLSLYTLLFLFIAAFGAGLIDAIAGGGGLIQVPALLIGLSDFKTVEVLGTNKSISIFGTTASARLYRKSVKTDPKFLLALVIPALLGSIGGASLASRLPTEYFRPVVLVLLIAVAIYTFNKPDLGQIDAMKHSTKHRTLLGISIAAVIGFYDGIFGPGTGSFLVLAMVWLGFAFLSASAIAKVVNVSTNLGAIIVFGLNGVILWQIGLTLAVANVAGAIIGAKIAIRGGSTLVRKVFLVVTVALIIKVALDTFKTF